MKERDTYRAGVTNQDCVASRSASLGSAKPAPAPRGSVATVTETSRALWPDFSQAVLGLSLGYILAHLLSWLVFGFEVVR